VENDPLQILTNCLTVDCRDHPDELTMCTKVALAQDSSPVRGIESRTELGLTSRVQLAQEAARHASSAPEDAGGAEMR
jgi:hypothetical protein